MNKNYEGNNSKFNRNENYKTKEFKKPSYKKFIKELKDGDFYEGTVKILRKIQPGPVIFVMSDGEGIIDGVIKNSEFNVDDIVKISGRVEERSDKLQVEIKSIQKSDIDFDVILRDKSKCKRTCFSIGSNKYDIMRDKFIEVASKIRYAIYNNQPILIRHHNDSDGINSGLSIEKSCKMLMAKIGINSDYNLYRSPSKAPFYEVTDVFRDLTLIKRLTDSHGQKKPLILILDNGSTPEDTFGLKTMQIMGYETIVIDHHNPVEITDGKSSVCKYLVAHLNPYLFGFDSNLSAGMLCYEVARMVSEDFTNPLAPAISGVSDHCEGEEVESYIVNSQKTREELGKIGVAIDYMAYHLKFDSGKGVFEEVYTNLELVEMINNEVCKGVDTQLQSTLPYLRTQEINGIIFSYIDLEKYTLRFTYPTPGKVIGMIHDKISEGKEHKAIISIGCLSDMLIIRATQPVLPVQQIIENLQKKFPDANVDGGGHEMAGSIKFVQAHSDKILENVKNQIKELKLEDSE